MVRHSCSSACRSSAAQRTAACRLKPLLSAHSVWLKSVSLGIAMYVWLCSSMSTPRRVSSLRRAGDDLVQHRLQRLIGWRGHLDEGRLGCGAAPIHAVQHQAVQMGVEVGRRAEALNQRDGAAVGNVGLEPSLAEQVARDHAVHHLQHRSHQLGLCGQQQAQRDGQ